MAMKVVVKMAVSYETKMVGRMPAVGDARTRSSTYLAPQSITEDTPQDRTLAILSSIRMCKISPNCHHHFDQDISLCLSFCFWI
jgi:hypothetical protein